MADIQRQIAASAKARAKDAPRHGCPGDCGVTVARHRLACPACWRLLPMPLRQRVALTNGQRRLDPDNPEKVSAHRQALAAAIAWYRDRGPKRAAPRRAGGV